MTVEGRQRFSVNVRYPQDLRSDLARLRQVLVPIEPGGAAAPMPTPMGDQGALWLPARPSQLLFAQSMPDMGAGAGAASGGVPSSRLPGPSVRSDAPSMDTGAAPVAPWFGAPSTSGLASPRAEGPAGAARRAYVPLGELADLRIVGGPPMVRDEDGMLVGYVYVDIDARTRDIGGYVEDAKQVVGAALKQGSLTLPPGYSLRWTGQFELLEQTAARMKLLIPLTLMIVVVLLFLHFKSLIEVLIVLLSIPFALVGSVWLLWLLDYRLSTAVWVGVIALVGLAAQTGIVMVVYIDHAFERRKRAGKIRDLNDIIWAHMEGTVLRVRPKLMTVSTMLMGLVPLLLAEGSGADVMKRIAAPMVGGLLTSAFLTLELIPVVYTYWRQEQLLWELLPQHDAPRLARLRGLAVTHGLGWVLAFALLVAPIYVSLPLFWSRAGLGLAGALIVLGGGAYLVLRPTARRLVWPSPVGSVARPG
jgi:hypothetical protein